MRHKTVFRINKYIKYEIHKSSIGYTWSKDYWYIVKDSSDFRTTEYVNHQSKFDTYEEAYAKLKQVLKHEIQWYRRRARQYERLLTKL